MFALKARKVKSSSMLTSEIFGWRSTSNLSNVVWTSATHHGENCEKLLDVFCNLSGRHVKVGQKNHLKSQPNCPWNWKLITSIKKAFLNGFPLPPELAKEAELLMVRVSQYDFNKEDILTLPSKQKISKTSTLWRFRQPVWLQQKGYPDSFMQTKNFKNFYTMEIPSILGLSRFGDTNHRQGTIYWSHCFTLRSQHNQSFCDLDPHLTPSPLSVFSQKQNSGLRIISCCRN